VDNLLVTGKPDQLRAQLGNEIAIKAMEGGLAGVQLLVPDDQVEAADGTRSHLSPPLVQRGDTRDRTPGSGAGARAVSRGSDDEPAASG
jgi:hypothetical protein